MPRAALGWPAAAAIAAVAALLCLAPADASVGAVTVSGGSEHVCARTTDGGVKCWGANYDGQLGDGTQTGSTTAVDVAGLQSGVATVAAGYTHTCALTNAGGARCWGYNFAGQIGTGSALVWITTPATPTGLGSGVIAIASGSGHSCALLDTDAVRCWGDNTNGQLGDGTTTDRSTPVDVSGLSSGVVAITAGAFHTCALLSTGAAQCWGLNAGGQLGNGTNSGPETCNPSPCSTTPVGVSGLSDAAAIVAGGFHTCAVTTSDAALCWGSNPQGQVGDGTTETRTAPVAVSGLGSGVDAIAGGGLHTCALLSTGGVQCWGRNADGELGDGTTTGSGVPVSVAGLSSGVAAIGAGYHHTCTALDSNEARCWGRNVYGQLGNGTTAPSATPVAVAGLSGLPALDTDGDGCNDKAEISTLAGSEMTGGRRSPVSFWDFFDTPDESNVRDGAIDLFGDIFRVASRFGAEDDGGAAAINRTSDPLSAPPPEPAYHPAFDRSAPPLEGDAWDAGAPDGVIDLFSDIFGVASAFGHECG